MALDLDIWRAGLTCPISRSSSKVNVIGQNSQSRDEKRWRHWRTSRRDVFLVVCRGICANLVGATSFLYRYIFMYSSTDLHQVWRTRVFSGWFHRFGTLCQQTFDTLQTSLNSSVISILILSRAFVFIRFSGFRLYIELCNTPVDSFCN